MRTPFWVWEGHDAKNPRSGYDDGSIVILPLIDWPSATSTVISFGFSLL